VTLDREKRSSSAKGAFGRHARHDNAGMRLVTAASGWRSSVRRSMICVVRQAGQRTHRNQYRAVIAAPMVGANSMGIRLAWRSFQAAIRPSASSSRAPCRGLLFGYLQALIFHFALVESHGGS
jgi:hypothetical protein